MRQVTDFEDIRPYNDDEFQEKMARLLQEPYFRGIINAIMPEVDYDEFCEKLSKLESVNEFQQKIILPWLLNLIKTTSDGFEYQGTELIERGKSYLYISNHRDIVLDSSFLCTALLKEGYPSCEIAIGSNLLIYNWISDFVRINKSFIVKRGIGIKQALEAAHQLSAYIHYAITEKKSSIWIAQREGRSKDSNDRTQESLIKMLGLEGDGNWIESLRELNITPVSISYEYDPCDYLKAYEFLQKSKDPDFKKSPKDDLKNMETGIMGYKGRMNFAITSCINGELDKLGEAHDKAELLQSAIDIIDRQIHLNYRIYPGNYIAYDKYYKTDRFADKYTPEQKAKFECYIDNQIAKSGEMPADDRAFVHDKMMLMYSNPLKNRIEAQQKE